MNEKQKLMFARIIEIMKQNEGSYNFYALSVSDFDDPPKGDSFSIDRRIVLNFMRDEGYVKQIYPTKMRDYCALTEKGWAFTSWEEIESEKNKQKDLQNLSNEELSLQVAKLREDMFDYQKSKDQSKWSFRISIAIIILLALTTMKELMCNKPG